MNNEALEKVRAALNFYAVHGAGCRKLSSVGEHSRNELDRDGGNIAEEALVVIDALQSQAAPAAQSGPVGAPLLNIETAKVRAAESAVIENLYRQGILERPTVAAPAPESGALSDTFQTRVEPWLLACFGEQISADRVERNHRFLEESLELVQSLGCTQSEAHQLVDYVFGRPVGEPQQEAGGVMVTLAALCRAAGLDMHDAGEIELRRIWTMVEKIRAKQAAKPKHSPLPIAADQPLKIVSLHHPAIEIRAGSSDLGGDNWPDGSLEIVLDDFVFVRVNYDYRYTSNGHRRWLAEEIVKLVAPAANPAMNEEAGR